ncbi:MAG: hypothetical protein BA862_11005 [Desulfobulbaceae bacterium S3730MH12]|nr:MAG: hypothetical protein BA862_11005 [Desulfobulbaceae bacterium S3730MH12]OEU84412.1 MAG: hypothetical protein BA873_08755 [Desulfobulbaceae bacterium C00003063]
MTITFSGLATGLDTNSIVSELMSLERQPLMRMEADKTWLNNRLDAYRIFDTKLNNFLASVKDLDATNDFHPSTINVAESGLFTASGTTDALPGSSYQIEVMALAQVQKNVTTGFSDRGINQFGNGTLSITVDGIPQNIAVSPGHGSLEGIMTAINNGGIGISATIINDGTANPYRLVLTGADSATTFSVDVSNLSNGDLLTPANEPLMMTQAATRAHIKVDNIDIYSDNNTISQAIPGITLNLLKAEPGTRTAMNVKLDEQVIKEQIQAFVNGYNDTVAFVTSQSVINGSEGGILAGDSGLNSVKRHLQDMLTTRVNNSGSFNYLSQLGLETQRDGTLKINDKVLDSALQENLDDVEAMLVGQTTAPGVATRFKEYLESLTSSVDGFFAGRKENTYSNLKRIDNRIAQTEVRLDHKENAMRARFAALEQLISGMNAQSSFLGQQMDMLNNMMTGNK